jgi:hypothetical protein
VETRNRVSILHKERKLLVRRIDQLLKTTGLLETSVKELRDQNAGLRSAIVGLQATSRRHERILLGLSQEKEKI